MDISYFALKNTVPKSSDTLLYKVLLKYYLSVHLQLRQPILLLMR